MGRLRAFQRGANVAVVLGVKENTILRPLPRLWIIVQPPVLVKQSLGHVFIAVIAKKALPRRTGAARISHGNYNGRSWVGPKRTCSVIAFKYLAGANMALTPVLPTNKFFSGRQQDRGDFQARIRVPMRTRQIQQPPQHLLTGLRQTEIERQPLESLSAHYRPGEGIYTRPVTTIDGGDCCFSNSDDEFATADFNTPSGTTTTEQSSSLTPNYNSTPSSGSTSSRALMFSSSRFSTTSESDLVCMLQEHQALLQTVLSRQEAMQEQQSQLNHRLAELEREVEKCTQYKESSCSSSTSSSSITKQRRVTRDLTVCDQIINIVCMCVLP